MQNEAQDVGEIVDVGFVHRARFEAEGQGVGVGGDGDGRDFEEFLFEELATGTGIVAVPFSQRIGMKPTETLLRKWPR